MAKFSYRISRVDTIKRKGNKTLDPTKKLTSGTFESETMQTAEAEFESIIAETLPPDTKLSAYKYDGGSLLTAQRHGTDPEGYRYIITLLVIEA